MATYSSTVELEVRRDARPRREGWFRRLVALLRGWCRRSRTRAALARFDSRMLADIGISRVDAWREINKPFWRA